MPSLPDRHLDSDAARRIHKVKRELVLDLYLQRGSFWETICDMGARWDIATTRQLPPADLSSPPMPGNRPDPGDFSKEAQELQRRWNFELDAIRDKAVPGQYRDWQIFGHLWREFLAVCVLYDPAETGLLTFAEYGGPHAHRSKPSEDVREEVPRILVPAVKQMRDGTKTEHVESEFGQHVIHEVGERHLKHKGIDLKALVRDVIFSSPQLWKEHHEWDEQHNPFRWYIEVDLEHTTEADARRAFKAIAAKREQPAQSGASKRDSLLAVQCAILYDRHNGKDPQDGRRKLWAYEKLAKEFGLLSARAAEAYVQEGRKLLLDKP